jgi:PhoPQ-activated pathogenicity-related protein
MTRLLIAVLLSVVLIDDIAGQDTDDPASALARYVASPDPGYQWNIEQQFEHRGTEFIGIRLRSQSWRDNIWTHQLYLIKPRHVDEHGQAVLVVAGGRWRDAYDEQWPESLPEEVEIFSRIAERLRSIVVVVAQVPFQPLFGITEDHLIAYTFDQFLQTGDTSWPLLLPMVKTVVRAMDTAQTVARMQWQQSIERFTVVGGSKRGWTTWLVAAVDARVSAIVPIVIDALNMAAHFPYQTEVWGSPSIEIAPYTERNLHVVLGSEVGRDLRRIVDPISYSELLTQPKLIVIATNDDYFPVDALNLYWRELEEPKYILYLPNDEHSTDDFRRIFRSLRFFHQSILSKSELPEVSWAFSQDVSEMQLTIHAQPRPRRVHAWIASADSRDFRNANWQATRIPRRDGTWSAVLARPQQGHSAIFAELTYGRGRSTYSISTNLCVVSALADIRESPGIAMQQDICGQTVRNPRANADEKVE